MNAITKNVIIIILVSIIVMLLLDRTKKPPRKMYVFTEDTSDIPPPTFIYDSLFISVP